MTQKGYNKESSDFGMLVVPGKDDRAAPKLIGFFSKGRASLQVSPVMVKCNTPLMVVVKKRCIKQSIIKEEKKNIDSLATKA